MDRALVIGQAVSTVKHPSMEGLRLLVMQALDADGGPDGDPWLVADTLGAGVGSIAIVCNDGRWAKEMIGAEDTPVRHATVALEDE